MTEGRTKEQPFQMVNWNCFTGGGKCKTLLTHFLDKWWDGCGFVCLCFTVVCCWLKSSIWQRRGVTWDARASEWEKPSMKPQVLHLSSWWHWLRHWIFLWFFSEFKTQPKKNSLVFLYWDETVYKISPIWSRDLFLQRREHQVFMQ